MVDYVDIAQLVHFVDAQKREVHFHFVSDCGTFEQTVTVARDADGESERGRTTGLTPMLSWLSVAVKRVLHQTLPAANLDPSELERLTLVAFEQVAHQLTLLDGQWIASQDNGEHPCDFFERQLRGSPITESYDLEVLVRVLLEVSRSDSHWRVEEKTFLLETVRDESLIARLQSASNITVAELAEVSSSEIKQTILMLAWAMAYADGNLDPQEMARLTHLCRGFMLSEQRVRELQLAAKLSLLDRYLTTHRGKVSSDELQQKFNKKALAWGVCTENLSKLRAWYPEDFPCDSETSQPLSPDDEAMKS